MVSGTEQMQRGDRRLGDRNGRTRIFACEPRDELSEYSGRNRLRRSHAHLAGARVCEIGDFSEALPQFVMDGQAPLQQNQALRGSLDTLTPAVEKPRPERVL